MRKKPEPEPFAELDTAPGGAAAVDRALTVLRAFKVGDGALTLAELSNRTQLYKSTLLRLLASLEHAFLIYRNADGRYGLGSEVARLYGVFNSSFSQRDVVMAVLQDLVNQTRESAALYVRQGDQRLCLYRVDSPHLLRDQTRMGDLLPLERGAGGQMVLAYTGARGPKYAKMRREQLAVTTGELIPELSGISAPVFKSDGDFLGAMNLSIPTYRFDIGHVAHVKAAAVKLTELFGGQYPAPEGEG